jgi:hypothetical protein
MSGYTVGNRIYNYCKNNPWDCQYIYVSPIKSLQSQINTINGEITTIDQEITTINEEIITINRKLLFTNREVIQLKNTNIIETYSIPQITDFDINNKPIYGFTNIRLGWYDPTFNKNLGKGNVCIGNLSNGGFYSFNTGNYNVSLGNVVLTKNVTGNFNVAMGHNSQFECSDGEANTSIGYNALFDNISGSYNTALGSAAGNNNLGSSNTFVGRRAGRKANVFVSWNNTTCLGSESIATGNNQVILGKSGQNVYGGPYNTTSDERDKTEIRDTVLGLNFIEKLRPVDYKYNFRNSNNSDDEIVIKPGTRYHHGLIAQEVKSTIDTMGVDFGGYQDHKINGGSDQLTLAYSELIGPMIKSIQELNDKIKMLEDKLSKQ